MEYVKAYMELGIMYQNINWEANDQEKSFYWLEKAAQENETEAQVRIAFMYKNGEGVKQNTMEATKWLKEAAERNPNGAKYNIGKIFRITNDLGDMSDFLFDKSIESILLDMNKLDKNS